MQQPKYGDLPKSLGIHHIDCREMMFYQYLPIKMAGGIYTKVEPRLQCFMPLIKACYADLEKNYSQAFTFGFVYLTVKHQYQAPGTSFNRFGWHSDGFMTDDLNYIWCDINPTVFNYSNFKLSQDHVKSLDEMADQAMPWNTHSFADCELLRLDQYNIHKVKDIGAQAGMRTFFKLSVSKEQYNLVGNSHNYLFDYKWPLVERDIDRNHPVKHKLF